MGKRYFTTETFDFLQDLEVNNERTWFKANQDTYETYVREPMLAFIEDVRDPLHKQVSKHLVADARKQGGSMFRIHRDVRFGKDKSPYKTQASAQFRHEQGKDVHAPGLYLHLEPGNVFMGGGMWMPDSDSLAAIRKSIDAKPAAWKKARDADSLKKWSLEGDALKRAPKGYDPEHPLIDDLRRKSFILVRPFTEKQVTSPKFLDLFLERAAETKPLMSWLAKSIGVKF